MNISKSTDTLLWPLIAVLIFFVFQVIGQFVVQTVQTIDIFSSDNTANQIGVGEYVGWAQIISSLATVAALSFVRGFGIKKSFAFPHYGRGYVALAFVTIILALVGSTVLNDLFESQLEWKLPQEYEQLYTSMMNTPQGILAACLFVPICEEVVFRAGIMNPMLSHGVNPWIPISVSALVFGVFHGNIAQMAYAIPVGFVFAVVYYLTRSLIITITCHVLNNFVAVLLILTQSQTNLNNFSISNFIGVIPAVAVVVVFSAVVAFLLYRLWNGRPSDAIEHADDLWQENDSAMNDSVIYDNNFTQKQ